MNERRAIWSVVGLTLALGLLAGATTERLTASAEVFLGVDSAVVFGLGIAFLEGPSVVLSIVIPHRLTRMWVRNALEAGGPFLAFAGYVVAYGLLRLPPFDIPWPWLLVSHGLSGPAPGLRSGACPCVLGP